MPMHTDKDPGSNYSLANINMYCIHTYIRHRWEDNIRMDLKKIGINTRNWSYYWVEINSGDI